MTFDLTSIGSGETITSISLSGSTRTYSGDSVINAYHVNDDSLGGLGYPGLTYNGFHNYDSYLGTESQSGIGPYSWDISAYDYSADLVDNTLTIALASDARATGGHWVSFNRDMSLNINTASVPEPSTLLLLGSDIAGFGFIRKRFKK